MQFKAITFLALAATLPSVLAAGCNSGIDTKVGNSCKTEGEIACANGNKVTVECQSGKWVQTLVCPKAEPTCIYCICQAPGPGYGGPPPPPKRAVILEG